jgi:hypothetical protein
MRGQAVHRGGGVDGVKRIGVSVHHREDVRRVRRGCQLTLDGPAAPVVPAAATAAAAAATCSATRVW